MKSGLLSVIETPRQGNRPVEGATWCADNGCFSDKWDEVSWWAYLVKNAHRAASCVFAVAPDVVGDAEATLAKSVPWMPMIRELGYPVAFVGQNGQERLPVPWDELDVLFIGGDDEWKLGPHARALVSEAKRRGKWVHMGRVNSLKRMQYAEWIGCDSADGTFIARGPDVNLPKMLRYIAITNGQSYLFSPERTETDE